MKNFKTEYFGFILIILFMCFITSSCEEEEEKEEFRAEAYFTINPQSGTTETEFTFDASGTETFGEWETIDYEWEFGDGATNYDGSAIETHKYNEPGEYTVVLNVDIYKAGSTGGASDLYEKNVSVTSAD